MPGLGFLLGLDDTESQRAIGRNQAQIGGELARQGQRAVGAATARTGVNPLAASRMSFEAQRQARVTAAQQAQNALMQQREADRERARQTIGGLFQTAGSVAGMAIPGAGPVASPMLGQAGGALGGGIAQAAVPGAGGGQTGMMSGAMGQGFTGGSPLQSILPQVQGMTNPFQGQQQPVAQPQQPQQPMPTARSSLPMVQNLPNPFQTQTPAPPQQGMTPRPNQDPAAIQERTGELRMNDILMRLMQLPRF